MSFYYPFENHAIPRQLSLQFYLRFDDRGKSYCGIQMRHHTTAMINKEQKNQMLIAPSDIIINCATALCIFRFDFLSPDIGSGSHS